MPQTLPIRVHIKLALQCNVLNYMILEFLKSEEGQGFSGQVCIVADSIGSILAYDALCRTTKYQSRHGSENSILDNDNYHRGKY